MEIQTGIVGYPVVTSHFVATPESDVVRICAHDFQRHGDAFGTKENACFRAFITLRSQFHLHDCSQRTLTEIVSKITPNFGLVLYKVTIYNCLTICSIHVFSYYIHHQMWKGLKVLPFDQCETHATGIDLSEFWGPERNWL